MNNYMKKRLAGLKKQLVRENLDAYFILSRPNTMYFTEFPGSSSYTIITQKKLYFITDFRYIEYAQNNIHDYKIIKQSKDVWQDIANIIKKDKVSRLGIENNIPLNSYSRLKKKLKGIKLCPDDKIISSLRLIKDHHEIKQITKAQRIADQSLKQFTELLERGKTEQSLVRELKWIYETKGSEDDSFPPIIAAGKNSALPHHNPSKAKLKSGDSVVIDFGCVVNGYHSDMTRTFFIEKAKKEIEKIYHIVLEAQQAALKAVAPGKACKDIDRIARDIIASYGYTDYFGHGLGHGVGLEIHEGPVLNPLSKDILKPGMVITIEPGIYIPGKGGVRIEDLVLVTEKGYKVLSKYTKQLVSC